LAVSSAQMDRQVSTSGLLVLVTIGLLHLAVGSAQDAGGPIIFQPPNHIDLATQYEKSGDLENAEAEYVAALQVAPTQKQAFEGLKRVISSKHAREFELARLYEEDKKWGEAELYFSKALAGATTDEERMRALNGIKRVKHDSITSIETWEEESDFLSRAGVVLLRFAIAVVVVFAFCRFIVALIRFSKSTVIREFKGDEKYSKLIAVAFPALRAKATAAFGNESRVRLADAVTSAYPYVPLNLEESDESQAIELGDFKLPNLNALVRLFVRPALEIEGGVYGPESSRFVYAHIWQRKALIGTSLSAFVIRRVPDLDQDGAGLELFVYDVFIRASSLKKS
jgi:hypothetical protein